MRSVRFLSGVAALSVIPAIIIAPEQAEARCYTFQESHNGTDLFNLDGGAKTAARIKLNTSIELWQKKMGIKKVRIGKVTIKCDPWNMDYILPHHRCYARARVCK
jgi:hypothetical protein